MSKTLNQAGKKLVSGTAEVDVLKLAMIMRMKHKNGLLK
jgi:hypothetical protein